MADLIAFHSYYSRHSLLSPSTMIPRPSSHKRSLSSENRSLSPDRTLTKARSANDLAGAVTEKSAQATRSTSVGNLPDSGFSTLKDPRLGSTPDISEESSPASHHPDLSNEVAALSVKLVQAINNQTTLDDNLVATRQELEQAQTRIRTLESENEKYRRDIDQEVVIKKSDVDYEILRLKAALADEKAQRALVEKEKKGIEQELETLTAALFEEANKMVAAAKLEREAVEKKNEQLRSQVKDTESLLASHQEQLAELKSVLQGMNITKDDIDARTIMSTAPSSPAGPQKPLDITKNNAEASILPEVTCREELLPGPSTSFPQYIKSICRTDVPAFEDFRDLFQLSTTASKPPSRATSGSYTGLNVMSLASFGGGAFGSSAISSPAKSQTHSPNGSLSSPQPSVSHIPLKETRFYKRVLNEDIEPTLRLDAAPGISWLTRRSVLSGICEGSLVVEPVPPATKKYEFPCSLCGERRTGDVNERTHRFRTSDSETAQRYPLCALCLEKVRSSCEFTGYLRLILDGHIRAGDAEEEKEFWEETIRLRERMFWSRVGAGIVPIFTQLNGAQETMLDAHEHMADATIIETIENHPELEYQPSESTDVQSKYSVDDHEQDNDGERHRLSLSEDPFVSAPSESPVSSTVPSPLDTSEQDKVTEQTVDGAATALEPAAEKLPTVDENEVSNTPVHVEASTAKESDRN
ncbi:putative GDP/GTP exchange factor Sec2p [Aspergillus steynii IBT 23096]|uniref:Putative GDP/GTP exchange factor Sec2p n=1 Tax=Aspergillus steynii IBT 23096 TaxID=1392250 RepID=A0A2I2GHR1_9EURO|nr:putative GDP/GTP exchange factor Sec2p [Aspergillus steynii IBT 23096]PLB52377.1 putative GDP/GTP exchange factor Sec2p [Aspergillus steynii IBT 23096]